MFNDTFSELVYILFNSQGSKVTDFRMRVMCEEHIQIASNATFVMITVHASSHKFLRKHVLGLEPVDRERIFGTLKDDYGLEDAEISDLLIVLGKL